MRGDHHGRGLSFFPAEGVEQSRQRGSGPLLCLVLHSGGLDSTVALAKEVHDGTNPTALFVGMGQANEQNEAEAVRRICAALAVPLIEFRSDISSLTQAGVMGDGDMTEPGSGFVPYRNLFLVSVAGILAADLGANRIVLGVLKDATGGGYRDTRPEFFAACEAAMQEAIPPTELVPVLDCPFAEMSKIDVWKLADELGILDLATTSFTCYTGGTEKHEWGSGCGTCRGCHFRGMQYKKAFA